MHPISFISQGNLEKANTNITVCKFAKATWTTMFSSFYDLVSPCGDVCDVLAMLDRNLIETVPSWLMAECLICIWCSVTGSLCFQTQLEEGCSSFPFWTAAIKSHNWVKFWVKSHNRIMGGVSLLTGQNTMLYLTPGNTDVLILLFLMFRRQVNSFTETIMQWMFHRTASPSVQVSLNWLSLAKRRFDLPVSCRF